MSLKESEPQQLSTAASMLSPELCSRPWTSDPWFPKSLQISLPAWESSSFNPPYSLGKNNCPWASFPSYHCPSWMPTIAPIASWMKLKLLIIGFKSHYQLIISLPPYLTAVILQAASKHESLLRTPYFPLPTPTPLPAHLLPLCPS